MAERLLQNLRIR